MGYASAILTPPPELGWGNPLSTQWAGSEERCSIDAERAALDACNFMSGAQLLTQMPRKGNLGGRLHLIV